MSDAKSVASSADSASATDSVAAAPAYEAPNPSIRLLFSLVSRRDFFALILPAIVLSLVAGGVAPFMTYVIGQVFNAFAVFAVSDASATDKSTLRHQVALSALELLGLGLGALALSSATSSLWIWTGERNTMLIRKRTYASVAAREMSWYDTKIGSEDSVQSADGNDGPVGAGGLMAKFAKDTEDIRMASSLACGMIVQHLTTGVVCVILGFTRSWQLTLVILTTVPVMMVIQFVTQVTAGPLIGVERQRIATAATLVDRAVNAIATVKAFNAEESEFATFTTLAEKMRKAAWSLNKTWAWTSGFTQFTVMAMFVQGFWFGAKLVRDGHASAGDVMAVFWACMIATTNLQMCIPHFVTLTKGEVAMSSLVALIEAPSPAPLTTHMRRPSLLTTLPAARKLGKNMRKLAPTKCRGSLVISNVSFAYPSRPHAPVLTNVTLFLASNDLTFIVGGSGSGKSTIAQLLLRMYTPMSGTITLDDQDVEYLDDEWTRSHVGAVSQSAILFDGTVHENVAMGLAAPGSKRRPEDATREEVEAACKVALMTRFIEDLPQGYDTPLGNGGANLSGGQRQRLAIARAMLRDPTILILDEATSALDATSRILVFEAIKRWRANKTTIVITHDLSQINPTDFVYVMRDGDVAEQGHRIDLEQIKDGKKSLFRTMAETQGVEMTDTTVDPWSHEAEARHNASFERHYAAEERRQEARPMSSMSGNWMFEAIHSITRLNAPPPAYTADRASRFIPAESFTASADFEPYFPPQRQRRPSTLAIDLPTPVTARTSNNTHRLSLQFSPTSPVYSNRSYSTSSTLFDDAADEKGFLESVGLSANADRWSVIKPTKKRRTRRDVMAMMPLQEVTVEKEAGANNDTPAAELGLFALLKAVYPTVPKKWLVFLGLCACAVSGAITPIFSFMLSKLFYEVSVGARNVSAINAFGGAVLAIAAADGVFMGTKYFVLETAAMFWVTKMRNTAFRRVLAQDKAWFDKSENSGARLVQVIIKDGDDARGLIAIVLGQAVVVITMFSVGLIWALVSGWQLTLVGFAIAPVFAATMVVQTNLVTKFETRNKRAREEVAKGYYDTILNIRGIRSMGFESVFKARFDRSADSALKTGVKGAFVEGCTYGVASSLIYMSEGLLFYVGALLVANGTYSYAQFVQVLNLVVFTVSIGSQLMAFTQRIAKATQATRDWKRVLDLNEATNESYGSSYAPVQGTIDFKNVAFAYPERKDVPVLRGVNLQIRDGESVAVVGSSGSGKSTVAALLQRLYEPSMGSVTVGGTPISHLDVHHLREHVAVVSQNPNLFDATVADNISYGAPGLPRAAVIEAAKAANVHEFIMGLPQQYDTMVGENAALISGGQAQRLQIARALARPARILILDECTSALDGANQAAVLDTILDARVGRTTLMVTHKLAAMRMCDRIVVLDNGVVAESGTYEELVERRGVFSQLALGGEWSL
ncbi:unnamed protein product [Peniophora sp. CBMAI 1063]|nr:unnamed protein product [Peniophora sp. CBMAI 1063]